MSTWTSTQRRYHHGNLPDAAVETACDLLAERGPDAAGLREVARRLGVNHAAIHQHFGSKTAFLCAVAARCYEDLALAMRRAARRAAPEPLARLEAITLAFQHFAIRNPGKIGLLSQPDMNSEALDDPALGAAHDRALGLLFDVIGEGQRKGVFVAAPQGDLAFAVWIFCLGYWENHRTRRGFDGRVPLAEDGWPRVRRHFRGMLGLVLRGLCTPEALESGRVERVQGALDPAATVVRRE